MCFYVCICLKKGGGGYALLNLLLDLSGDKITYQLNVHANR